MKKLSALCTAALQSPQCTLTYVHCFRIQCEKAVIFKPTSSLLL
uniref:Uncharacterized protein n=1 Tax=Nelumbo nucifera TaxID=4432 RepID=A0A822Z6U9_NELNU|nr:TPA_asm: hypothetical protein HUJ06_000314 [Nelumbo nucifera]